MATDKQHDVDVRINSKINFYGPVVMVGSVSVSGVSLLFLGIWMATHWLEAVFLSAILVYRLRDCGNVDEVRDQARH